MLSHFKYILSLKAFQSIYQLLVFAFFLLLALGYASNPNLAGENGLYENIQLFFLVTATFICILALTVFFKVVVRFFRFTPHPERTQFHDQDLGLLHQ